MTNGLKIITLLISTLQFQPPTVLSQTVDITAVVTINPSPPAIPEIDGGKPPQLTRIHAWDFSPTSDTFGAILTIDNVVRLVLFNLNTGAKLKDVEVTRRSDRFNIRSIAFSPDGGHIAIPMGAERKLTIWNAMSGMKEAEGATNDDVDGVDWVGTTIAAVAGKFIEFWKAQPLMKEASIKAGRTPTEWPMAAKLSSDGNYLSIRTNTPGVYIATRSTSTPLPLDARSISITDWSPDGTLLAVGCSATPAAGTTVDLWKNVKSLVDTPFDKKAEISSSLVPPPEGSWTTMTWDPTGRTLALGDSKGTCWFLDPTGKPLKTFVPHLGIVPGEMHWHGNRLVTWGPYPERVFKVWAISTTPVPNP